MIDESDMREMVHRAEHANDSISSTATALLSNQSYRIFYDKVHLYLNSDDTDVQINAFQSLIMTMNDNLNAMTHLVNLLSKQVERQAQVLYSLSHEHNTDFMCINTEIEQIKDIIEHISNNHLQSYCIIGKTDTAIS